MSSPRPEYPPLTTRHKAVFLGAAALALALATGLSLARLALIRWWIVHCDGPASACDWAEAGFTWWWVALVVGMLLIGWGAHRITADRLVVQ